MLLFTWAVDVIVVLHTWQIYTNMVHVGSYNPNPVCGISLNGVLCMVISVNLYDKLTSSLIRFTALIYLSILHFAYERAMLLMLYSAQMLSFTLAYWSSTCLSQQNSPLNCELAVQMIPFSICLNRHLSITSLC